MRGIVDGVGRTDEAPTHTVGGQTWQPRRQKDQVVPDELATTEGVTTPGDTSFQGLTSFAGGEVHDLSTWVLIVIRSVGLLLGAAAGAVAVFSRDPRQRKDSFRVFMALLTAAGLAGAWTPALSGLAQLHNVLPQ